MEVKLVPVARRPKPAREIPDRWSWIEPSVWTDQMLLALERGVKNGKWHSLIDKVYRPTTLALAFDAVKRNKGAAGVDKVSIEKFRRHRDSNLMKLSELLETNRYQPQCVRRVWITKPGKTEQRPLGIPTVRDRVVQSALRMVVEPIFENEFSEHSYGFRPKRGCKDALRGVWNLLQEGYRYVLDADLKGYFDTIDHEILMQLVRSKIADNRILELIQSYLNQKVMETSRSWTPESGTPQGAVISPLLANIYLNPLDHKMANDGYKMIRYADDFVILCKSRKEAETALSIVKLWCEEMKLTLHPDKTKVVSCDEEGFEFLGYRFHKNNKYVCKKNIQRLRSKVSKYTRRNNAHSMATIISFINPIIRGWFEYYKHSHISDSIGVDGWIRMRLRSIKRKRNGGRGRGRGMDNHKYPNTYFHELGLFSLALNREKAVARVRS
ncbi:MAG: group II intron reverse transcriptase/maturase [Candidatus Zophobacter franzmannii]|jgi:RNA-directed DNA polymerase|nr:group II intron reverse transcriptase/maturase [Candidatus Zophobacter franzmannii]